MMNTSRLCGGIAAALALSMTVTGWAAPTKKAKKHAAPTKQTTTAVTKPATVAPGTAATPSPTPTPGDVILYGGNPAAAAGLSLASFGGGTVEESTDQAFAKSHSLKVTTLDDYQGATLTFTKPVDLGDMSDKSRFLAITVRLGVTPPSSTQEMGMAPTGHRSMGMASPGGGGGMMAPGGGGMNPDDDGQRNGGGFPGQNPNGFGQGQDMPAAVPTALKNVHLILTLANGTQADLLRPIPTDAQTGQDQWVNIAIPLPSLGFAPSGAASPLQSLTIAGDDYAILFVGQIKLTTDTTPISCFAGDQQSTAVGQPLELRGSASSGLTALHYSWDFDAKDGITEQASGPIVTTQYLKPGDYKVTLTVTDIDSIKAPATSTTTVHVQ
jgi:PKD repeat protein